MAPKRKNRKTSGQKLKQGTRSIGDNPENCQICFTPFNYTERRPRTLPCGHTFCTQCINGLQKQNTVICATCSVRHTVPEAGEFPISYIVEAFMKRLRDIVASTSPPACTRKGAAETGRSLQKGTTSLSRSMHSLLQEKKAKAMSVITACKEVQSQLDQYQTTLTDWHNQQQLLEDKLQAITDGSRSSRELLRQEKSKAANKKQQVHQGEQQLQGVLQTLERISTEQQALSAVGDIIRCTDDVEKRMKHCREMFPDVHTVTTSRKTIAASMVVANATEIAEYAPPVAAVDASLPTDPTSTLTKRFQSLVALPLKAEDLHSLTQPARTLLEAYLVFAGHEVNGRSRHAKICLEDGRVYLYSLRDEAPPLGAAILQVDEVVPPCRACLVFLDLAWPGTPHRRVLLRLYPDNPMGRQFALLCTGQRGPCYANTNLYGVAYKGKLREFVMGGDYDRNNGTGGPALLPDLDKGEYRKSCKTGEVIRIWRGNESDWNALFGIRTRNMEKGIVCYDVFGEVEEGLDVVVAAAHHTPMKEVTVVDCGVVLL